MINSNETFYFKAFGLTIQSPIPVRGLIAIEPIEETDIKIVFEKIDKYPELFETAVNRKRLTATFGMFNKDTNDSYLVWESHINFRLIDGKTMIVDTIETDLDFLSLFIVSEPLGILLFQRGDILLHASAIKLPNGDGIVFMGEPGAGKSTTAAAFVKEGCKIISDDLVAIRLINNKPYLIPSFPQIKLWKKSVEGLGYGYDEVERIVEGVNKFAYQNEDDFDGENVILKKIVILGGVKEFFLSETHIPLELFRYNALPNQLLAESSRLKYFFENTKIITNSIVLETKEQLKSFQELIIFVKSYL